ncbi:hypothetical protein PR048_005081 [Dryococelus australis]|uniref:Uncharacterized protein n=1 Tax=Dryococelus australis TaxID=614101 RepID=A0ABQ9I767_9NEOP|nr:hypothetical protein PR048_005081 [Dryococelus australis]
MSGSDFSPCLARNAFNTACNACSCYRDQPSTAAYASSTENMSQQSTPRSCRRYEAKARGQQSSSCTSQVPTTGPNLCKQHGMKTKQVPAIVEVSSPLSHKVMTNDGVWMKRHVDQLLTRHVSPQEDSTETPAATGNDVAIAPNVVEV